MIVHAPSRISLSWTMDIPLTVGEMVTVDLPGFRRVGGSGMLVRSSERTVYWDDCAEKLFVEANPKP